MTIEEFSDRLVALCTEARASGLPDEKLLDEMELVSDEMGGPITPKSRRNP